jgi:predicted N-acetyltransferase YhbS
MVRIRALTLQDIDRADEVARAAFQVARSFRPRFRRYLEMRPDGWLVALDGDRVVGTVGAITYETFGYLGLLAVDPAWQRQGLGGHLLEVVLQRLGESGVDCVVLDASDAGRGLYERMGFVAAGPSLVLTLDREQATVAAASCRQASPPSIVVSDLSAGGGLDRADLVALDRELFGADRGTVWGILLREPDTRAWLVRSAAGEALGYLCVQEHQIGPWGSRTAAAAAALFAEAVVALPSRAWRVQLPGDNVAGRDLLGSLGFVEERSLLHMRRGPCLGRPGWRYLYGKGSFCLG